MVGKSERFIMLRLDSETLDRWKARAAVGTTSIAALIFQAMEGQSPGPSEADLGQAAQQAIVTKDADIASLKKALATAKAVRPAKGASLAKAQKQVETLAAEVASLKRELAERPIAEAISTRHIPMPIVDPHRPRPVVAGQLLGNPVLKSAVPQVQGEVEWCGVKGQEKGKK